MVLRHAVLGVGFGAVLALSTTPSLATPSAAREAYEVGKRAYDAGDWMRAAQSFAEADELAPNRRVLELALASAHKADAPALGMELAERARARNLSELAETASELFAPRVGKIVVRCPSDVRCTAKLDDAPVEVGATRFASVGPHAFELDVDGAREQRTVHVARGHLLELSPTRAPVVPRQALQATPMPIPLAKAPARRLDPVWFWIAASATGASAIGATASGFQTLALHDDLAADRTNADIAERGRAAELRTNVFLVSTATLAVATGVVAWFVFGRREVTHERASLR